MNSRALFGMVTSILLAGCSQAISNAEEVVARNMKDPSSVQFRDMKEAKNGAVCGSFNAKNSFGAYSGFRDFVLPAGASEPIMSPEAALPADQQQDAINRCSSSSGLGYAAEHAACDDVSKITEQLKQKTAYMSAHTANCL